MHIASRDSILKPDQIGANIPLKGQSMAKMTQQSPA